MGIISSAMLHSWEEMGCLDNDNSEELEQLKTENARLITCLQEIKAIVSGDYEMLDPQALQDIKKILTKAESKGANQ